MLNEHLLKNIGLAHIGLKVSDETKRKISNSSKGKTISIETRKKMSEAQKGKILSEEHRQALSEGWKHREHGPNLGKKFTEPYIYVFQRQTLEISRW